MNISRDEQRVLHALAQGGHIRHLRGTGNKVADITCFTHDGMVLECGTLGVFTKLRRKGLIASLGGGPYRITRLGRLNVRAQVDNRTRS